jgi:hypothetical protein
MRLVEVVSTVSTTPDTEATALEVASVIGKRAVRCADRAGFIVNALLFPYLNDAVKMLEAHYATADDIDSAMKVGCGYPMGPFELLDVVGTDVALAIERALYQEFHEPGFAPAPCSSTGHSGPPRPQDRHGFPRLQLRRTSPRSTVSPVPRRNLPSRRRRAAQPGRSAAGNGRQLARPPNALRPGGARTGWCVRCQARPGRPARSTAARAAIS